MSGYCQEQSENSVTVTNAEPLRKGMKRREFVARKINVGLMNHVQNMFDGEPPFTVLEKTLNFRVPIQDTQLIERRIIRVCGMQFCYQRMRKQGKISNFLFLEQEH